MTSVYQSLLGSDFDKLHPNIQWRYGIDAAQNLSQVTDGMLESVYVNPMMTSPFVKFMARRSAMTNKSSRLVPFTMNNYFYIDELGRECMATLRTFNYSSGAQKLNSVQVVGVDGLVDYFGDGPAVLFPIRLKVGPGGSVTFDSGPMRFLMKGPKWSPRSIAAVRLEYVEKWDEENNRFHCDGRISNSVMGEMYRYRGWFAARDEPCTIDQVPDEAWPYRLVEREN